jgi:hypothetical protein
MTHNWKIKKQKIFLLQSKNFPPDKRHPGPTSDITDRLSTNQNREF